MMLHLHSILRWAVLALLVLALVRSLIGWINRKPFSQGDEKIGLYLMIFTHVQLILGLILYYTQGWLNAPFAESMKNDMARFWKVEHIFAMFVAIALITIGRIKSKRVSEGIRKHRISVIFYGIALILIIWGIPWEVARMY